MTYDSRPDTYAHIEMVRFFMTRVIHKLLDRQERHDQSKLSFPELEVFNEYTPKLREMTYGSDEYNEALAEMKQKGLYHHYAVNSHHPEYYEDGIEGMSLLDIIEMLCDWKAATLRHEDGDLMRSIEINQERFGYTDEMKQILINTAVDLYLVEDEKAPPEGKRKGDRRAHKWNEIVEERQGRFRKAQEEAQ